MAHCRHFAPQAGASALAALLGIGVLVTGCGSDTSDDPGSSEDSEVMRRQRSDTPGNGAAPSNQSSTGNDEGSDTDNEAAQQGELDGADADGEEPPNAGEGAEPDPEEAAPAQVFSACVTDGGAYEDCESIYVTMQQSDPPQCVQLTIDNCGTYGRRTLSVTTPGRWELSSGSLGTSPTNCELGVYNASNTVIIDASGTIGWDEAADAPTDLMLELTLEPSRTGGDAPSVELTTPEPLEVGACPD